ncbi:MAG: cysteine dioxygenase family protein [Deltaproteobacteria bacterium]|nr:cysteine dioxygenase family protein [Deltaproteobacteria bacterium]
MSDCLKSLISRLEALGAKASSQHLAQILEAEASSYEVIKKRCEFSESRYTRKRIAIGEFYELLLIGWLPGQASTIHDHLDSSCAFRVLSGVATEKLYSLDTVDPEGIWWAKFQSERDYQPGDICQTASSDDIHRVSNDHSNEPLVTLHIYSPPIKMRVYQERKAV